MKVFAYSQQDVPSHFIVTVTPATVPEELAREYGVVPTFVYHNAINGFVFPVGSAVQITADAIDDTSVSSVKFYVNGVLQCTDTAFPYTCTWNTPFLTLGAYSLDVVATDLADNAHSSSAISVSSQLRNFFSAFGP